VYYGRVTASLSGIAVVTAANENYNFQATSAAAQATIMAATNYKAERPATQLIAVKIA
jgi:hypothetical protein